MTISLTGKKALVGGSSSGLGKAVAVQLANCGAGITLVGRNEKKLKEALSQLDTGDGQEHHYLVVDYSNYEDYSEKISRYFEKNITDILVNNTQGPPSGKAIDLDGSAYQEAFDLLFKGVVHTTTLALEGMIEKRWGRIINIASVSVKEPLPDLALSNSIRAAVVSWGKGLSADVGSKGITVNSILTGFFDTERLARLSAERAKNKNFPETEIRASMEGQTAVKRIGEPEEFGYLAAFLASEKASFITGAAIPIDGGYLKSL